MDANQVWDVDEAIERMQRLAEFDPYWIEEPTSADDVLGHAAIARRDRADPGRHRRALPQPGHLQAAAAGRGDRRLPGRRLPARRRQRGARRAAAGGQVRRAGLPARRRRRPVRDTSSTCRSSTTLRRGEPGGPDGRVRRPPARALPRPGPHPRRPLPAARAARLLGGDPRRLARRVRVPGGAAWRS